MPPFPGMPYGTAPGWCFPLAESSLYLLFFFCLRHAWKKGPSSVAYLLGGTLFGLLLEYMEVLFGNYTYGRFWVMLGRTPRDIPFCIGVAWGVIMYTARLLSDWLGLPLLAAAAFDTLLALNIDFSIDIVAYRMHMWHWDWSYISGNPLTSQWFGVPFGNFFGWQTVVFCYSTFSRLLARWVVGNKPAGARSYLNAFLAIIFSVAILYTSEKINPKLAAHGITSAHRVLLAFFVLVAIVALGWKRRTPSSASPPSMVWTIPMWFHLLFAGYFFALGFYIENSWMTFAVIANFAIGALVHAFPHFTNNTPNPTPRPSLHPQNT